MTYLVQILVSLGTLLALANNKVASKFGVFCLLMAVCAAIWSAIKPAKAALAEAKAKAEAEAEAEAKAKAEAEAKAKAEAEANKAAEMQRMYNTFLQMQQQAEADHHRFEEMKSDMPAPQPSSLQATTQQGYANLQGIRDARAQAAHPYVVPVHQGANPYAVPAQAERPRRRAVAAQQTGDATVPVAGHPVYPYAVPAQPASQVGNLAEGIEFPTTAFVEEVADAEELPWHHQYIPDVPGTDTAEASTWRPRT